ncbi:cullin-4 [Phtheirospermum japonicum]|uniref:Cullin-4 n=1 Tax=Phtheirospermum japonicum TaxID=374723 RepID=A0A830C4D2_9LAMI|nr:cullin-4 [Phtheirospermum japonicum]
MVEDDPSEGSPSSAGFGRSASASGGGVTSNLSRKNDTPPNPTKNLMIKLLKAKPTLPSNFEENTWATFKSVIRAIFMKRPDPCDLEKLYQTVNDLFLHKMGDTLYQRIENECEEFIRVALQALVGQSKDRVVFLSLVEKCWQDFCDQMLMIRGIALYLDRTYVKQTPNVCSLWDMGLQLFRKHLSRASEVEHKTGIYPESFEKPFLECTSGFYAAEGVKYMQQSDVPDYLKHVETRLQEENERCLLYLDASTRKPLVATAERQLLERHISAILDKGFMGLMDGKRIEDLQRMYVLFSRVNALESLRQSLNLYIRKTGQTIVMDEEKDKDMVPCVLEFKANLDRVWEESFLKNEAFSNTIKNAFEHLINIRQNRSTELIAKFVDEKFRAGNKGASEEELEGTLEKVLVLFRYIQSKDVFEAFYKKDLAKRLLLGKSASIDAEKSMISKDFSFFLYSPQLKTECGSQFTNKLEGMFKDIFKEFYLSKYSGRRLMWQISLGHCVLKAKFPKGQKELAVSLFQTVVLMLFNDAGKLSFEDIKESTGIEDKELRRTLESLACGKFHVLQKNPKGRDVEDEDNFVFNDQFNAPIYRIKVNVIQMKETVEENASTTERVFQDHQYQVDAAIVRIMKTRKVLSHTLLIT